MEESMVCEERTDEPLPTIWCVPDDLWMILEALIKEHDPPKRTGRKRIDARKALDGIIFRGRSGCQWNRLPRDFGDDSSVSRPRLSWTGHRTFQRWNRLGLYEKLWAVLSQDPRLPLPGLISCEELGGVDWEWQAADAMLGKARGVPKRGGRRGGRS